jgi:DnaJ-class molecular chaperone
MWENGISYDQLATMLRSRGYNLNARTLSNKLARGSFSARFLFDAFSAMGLEYIRIPTRFHKIKVRAFETLEVSIDAPFEWLHAAYRRLAEANHPDAAPGDAEAAKRFHEVQAAYEVLRKAGKSGTATDFGARARNSTERG